MRYFIVYRVADVERTCTVRVRVARRGSVTRALSRYVADRFDGELISANASI